MDRNRFEKQLEFILEVDKEKNILRQTHLSGYTRQENDAEHAWHMALMIYLLKEYANEEFDLAKAMAMALIHDIVEIDAGDTYCYDQTMLSSQKERESLAANRIFGLLPQDQKEHLMDLFYEFEKGESPEARFAKVMDNFQPLLLNDYNNGRDWVRNGIDKERVINRQKSSKLGSEEIWQYTKELIEKNAKKGNLKDNKIK
ncbi:MAG: HD domain-containing protein [Clostridiales bacterium]|nr:HD domain-containing protein [Clostridiales bacterium]